MTTNLPCPVASGGIGSSTPCSGPLCTTGQTDAHSQPSNSHLITGKNPHSVGLRTSHHIVRGSTVQDVEEEVHTQAGRVPGYSFPGVRGRQARETRGGGGTWSAGDPPGRGSWEVFSRAPCLGVAECWRSARQEGGSPRRVPHGELHPAIT